MNMPSISRTPNITASIVSGAMSKLVTQAISPALPPEKDRILLKVAEPKMISSATTVTRVAPASDFHSAEGVSERKAAATTSTPKQPKAADSEGVAQPIMISRITPTTIETMGRTSRSSRTARSARGAVSTS